MSKQSEQHISEEDLDKYFTLSEQKKEIEKRLKVFNQKFQHYFDNKVGENQKGEVIIGKYKLQRQIRRSIYYEDEKTVKRLEQLNLHDCIQVIQKPDQKKIDSAITLGIIEDSQISDCRHVKQTKAILVKKL